MKNGKKLCSKFFKELILVILLLLLLGLVSCSKRVVFYTISQQDIIRIKEGEEVVAPKDGYFLSDLYMKEAVKATVQ